MLTFTRLRALWKNRVKLATIAGAWRRPRCLARRRWKINSTETLFLYQFRSIQWHILQWVFCAYQLPIRTRIVPCQWLFSVIHAGLNSEIHLPNKFHPVPMTLLLLQLMGMKYKCLHRWLSGDLTHQISGCFCQSWSTVCYQTGPIVLLRLTLLLFIGSLMLCCLFPLWLLLGSPSQAISQPSTRDTSLGLTDTSRNILVLGLQIDPNPTSHVF